MNLTALTKMKLSVHAINGGQITYVGSLNNKNILLFIGRSNSQKNSAPIQALIEPLFALGFTQIWVESIESVAGKLLDNKYNQYFDLSFIPLPKVEMVLRKLIKAFLLLAHPKHWSYFIYSLKGNQIKSEVSLLKQVIRFFGVGMNIYILSHSAGGRAASLLASELSVKKLICFGYPFKHPEEQEDQTRTIVLESIGKPFLIFQGLWDEYGGKEVPTKYNLSPFISFSFINTNHEYEGLAKNEWVGISDQIMAFIKN